MKAKSLSAQATSHRLDRQSRGLEKKVLLWAWALRLPSQHSLVVANSGGRNCEQRARVGFGFLKAKAIGFGSLLCIRTRPSTVLASGLIYGVYFVQARVFGLRLVGVLGSTISIGLSLGIRRWVFRFFSLSTWLDELQSRPSVSLRARRLPPLQRRM